MAKRKRYIPFSWRNVLLGLEGESKKLAELDYYYNGEELERKKIELQVTDEQEKQLKLLDLDYIHSKIEEIAYEKKKADIKKEAWVYVLRLNVEKSLANGYFELDWNSYFIKALEDEGFKGSTDEDLVNDWLTTICRNIALGEIDPEDIDKKRASGKHKREDGKTEYS